MNGTADEALLVICDIRQSREQAARCTREYDFHTLMLSRIAVRRSVIGTLSSALVKAGTDLLTKAAACAFILINMRIQEALVIS
jgi:hypothetical protein